MNYLQLIKYKNLALLAFIQIIIRYGFLKQQNVWQSLSDFQFGLLVFSTICIAGGYYIINALFDDQIDFSNSKISETNAYYFYAILSIIGVLIGMYLSNVVQKPGFIALFIFMVALGYFQATTLKEIVAIKLVVKPLLASFSILIIPVFDLYPATYDENRRVMTLLFSILKDYAIFVFIIMFIRELISDLILIKNNTSSVQNFIGLKKTTYLICLLIIAPTLYLVYYTLIYLLENNLIISVIYMSIAVLSPLFICLIKTINATESKDYIQINTYLKYILILGVFSIFIITFNIQHNV
jgi:4-hydroxybenzoate polyprenyltransferase